MTLVLNLPALYLDRHCRRKLHSWLILEYLQYCSLKCIVTEKWTIKKEYQYHNSGYLPLARTRTDLVHSFTSLYLICSTRCLELIRIIFPLGNTKRVIVTEKKCINECNRTWKYWILWGYWHTTKSNVDPLCHGRYPIHLIRSVSYWIISTYLHFQFKSFERLNNLTQRAPEHLTCCSRHIEWHERRWRPQRPCATGHRPGCKGTPPCGPVGLWYDSEVAPRCAGRCSPAPGTCKMSKQTDSNNSHKRLPVNFAFPALYSMSCCI